jgi:hypothetical protein
MILMVGGHHLNLKHIFNLKTIIIFILILTSSLYSSVSISGRSKVEYENFKVAGNAVNPNLATKGDNPLIQLDLSFIGTLNSFLKAGAILRFENNLRGFYGTGDIFQAREVFVQTILLNFIRLNLGDFRKSLTRLTLWADEKEFEYESKLFLLQREDAKYQAYLTEKNSWPLEGLDLKAEFNIENFQNYPFPNEFSIEGFIARIDTASESKSYDRYFSAARICFYNSEIVKVGGTGVFINDLKETKSLTPIYSPIAINIFASDISINLIEMLFKNKNIKLKMDSEIAKSITTTNSFEYLPKKLADTGLILKAEAGLSETKAYVKIIDIGNEFLSPGAQSWTFNYYGQNYLPEQNLTNSLFFRNYNSKLQIIHRWNLPLNISMPFSDATPNRNGLGFGFNSKNLDFIEFSLKKELLKEIRPTGCKELKNFNISEAGGKIYLDKFFDIKFFPVLNIIYFNEEIKRNDDKNTLNFDESENLKTKLFGSGAEFYFLEELIFLFAYQKIEQKGKVFFPVSQTNTPIIITGYQKYFANFVTTVYSFGFYYKFSKLSSLRAEYTKIKYENKSNSNSNYTLDLIKLYYYISF